MGGDLRGVGRSFRERSHHNAERGRRHLPGAAPVTAACPRRDQPGPRPLANQFGFKLPKGDKLPVYYDASYFNAARTQ